MGRLTTLAAATPRLRGRAGVKRRHRWLSLHPLCCDCEAEGFVTLGQEVDHVVPLWKGGQDDESNFATRCKDHHAAKTAKDMGFKPKPRIGVDGWPE